jgi:peptidoglycan/xylan/chitin deacetylase (PgdA/CDA1 family)
MQTVFFMIGNVLSGVRTPLCIALGLGLVGGLSVPAASAADCPGHPDALGTSRTLVVDPHAHPRIGTMQYPETLPLRDHEVVLTFDDGPLPHNSNQILDILASQCVKATFFEIGRMAQSYPEGVRKLIAAGHSVGTHSQTHPLTMNKMPIDRARQEIDDGIASVQAALGDNSAALAPFFRIPGLMRAEGVEDYLASKGIMVWSADFLADDWRHISSQRVYDLAIKRLEDKGKGILLLHDIQARTVAALPRILTELKARGYRIVHVVPAGPQNPATPTEPQDWLMHLPSEDVAISRWPRIPNFVFAGAGALPAPSLSDLDWRDEQSMTFAEDRSKWSGRGVPLPRQAPWPRLAALALTPDDGAALLAAPAPSVFEIQEGLRAVMRGAARSLHHAETGPDHEASPIEAKNSRRPMRGKAHPGRVRQAAGHGVRNGAHAGHGTLKHLVQVRKRSA